MLGNDRDLAEALALTGVVCQATPMRPFVERELESRHLSARLLDDLLELSSRRILLVHAEEDDLMSFV